MIYVYIFLFVTSVPVLKEASNRLVIAELYHQLTSISFLKINLYGLLVSTYLMLCIDYIFYNFY